LARASGGGCRRTGLPINIDTTPQTIEVVAFTPGIDPHALQLSISPGVSKDTLRVKVDGDNLLIEGEGSVAVPEAMELVCAEIRAPYYRRSFTLSRELDASKIEANLKDGVLKLRIPKAEEAKPRRIEINIG
jgi:HSP20 family protein